MKLIIEKISRLIEVKKMIALLLTIMFCILSVKGTINAEQFQTIFVIIISFYFGQSTAKANK